MPLLIAVGPEPLQKWEYPLSHQSKVRIGRFTESNQGVLWDLEVSRDHADIHWENGKYHVTCLENACNPIIAHGRSYKKIKLDVGGEFQIGKTHFRIVETDEDSEVRTMLSQTIDRPGEQTQYALRLADLRAELVSSSTSTLWTSSSEKHLAQHVIDILSKVILHAEMIVLLECSLPDLKARNSPKVLAKKSLARKQETAIDIPMIVAAIAKSKSVLKIRNETQNEGLPNEKTGNGRWSFCTPIQSDDAHDWCVYVAGRFGEDLAMPSHLTTEDLNGDVAFTELVAQMLKAIRKVLMLEDRFAGIRQFFSPAVMKSVENLNNDMSLEPTESETAILFCDLRGYSRVVEKGQENLKVLLEKVSNALGIMTQNIIKHDGVIADFQGDSALGFWGWPVPLSQGPLPACKAALEILDMFRQESAIHREQGQKGFKIGIGLSFGRAIAGRIGSEYQAKIGVFGPVVNLGARLESATKQIGVRILMDQATADYVNQHLPSSIGRSRRIGLVEFAGLSEPRWISELLPPQIQSNISNQNICDYEQALEFFIQGKWEESLDLLGKLPVKDRAKDFLLLQIANHNYQPPSQWDGVISLSRK